MNRDKRPILFSKVKQFACYRKKKLRFNLNPHLDREECLKEDLKLLRTINYDPSQPQESEVICERILTDTFTEKVVLGEGNTLATHLSMAFVCGNLTIDCAQIWRFVFSDEWAEFSSLRISEGRLLDTLLYFLHGLMKQGALRTYKQACFDCVTRHPITPVRLQNENPKSNSIPLKIKFTYYALDPEVNIKDVKLTTSQPKRRVVSIPQRPGFAHVSHTTTYSEVSFRSSSECGDFLQSVELDKQASQSSRKLSEGDINPDSFPDIKLSVKSESNQAISVKSFTAISDQDAPGEEPSTPLTSDTNKMPSCQKNNTKCSSEGKNIIAISGVEAIVPRETTSGSAVDGYKSYENSLPTATSLQTKIASLSACLSKRADITNKTSSSIRRASQSPELIQDTVVFETDYDVQKIKKSSKLHSSRLMNCNQEMCKGVPLKDTSFRKQSRPYLTDPEEHVILPDDGEEQVIKESFIGFSGGVRLKTIQQSCAKKQHCKVKAQGDDLLKETSRCPKSNSNTGKYILCKTPLRQLTKPCPSNTNSELNSQKVLSKSLNRYTPTKVNGTCNFKDSVYLKIIENQRNAQKQTLSQDETSQNESCSDDRGFLMDREALKKIATQSGKTKRKPGKVDKTGKGHQKLFNDMISNYTVKIFKQKRKFESIKSGIPVNEHKDQIVQMMENFLEEKYLPKLKSNEDKPCRSIKLTPLINPPKPSVTSLLGQIHHETNATDNLVLDDFFPEKIPADFVEMLTRACQDFLVRKEQLTMAHCWESLTSITINRKLSEQA